MCDKPREVKSMYKRIDAEKDEHFVWLSNHAGKTWAGKTTNIKAITEWAKIQNKLGYSYKISLQHINKLTSQESKQEPKGKPGRPHLTHEQKRKYWGKVDGAVSDFPKIALDPRYPVVRRVTKKGVAKALVKSRLIPYSDSDHVSKHILGEFWNEEEEKRLTEIAERRLLTKETE